MKTLLIILVSLLTSLTANAEQVATPITTSKKWVVNKITGHAAWNTDSCVASTPVSAASNKASVSVLEVYAEKVGELYAEPTIQILVKEPKQVYLAEVNTDKGIKWNFTLASVPVDPELQAVMARIQDREAIINALKSDSTITVRLKDNKGKTINTLQYSLSGSSKAIDEQFKNCGLKFEAIP